METLKFKTTIKCSGCVANVTPALNEAVGKDKWNVDIQAPDKVLTISLEDDINPTNVVKAIEGAGYKAEQLG
jgi:copper chaperone CopZ